MNGCPDVEDWCCQSNIILGLPVQKNIIRCKRTVLKYSVYGICCLGSLIYQPWNLRNTKPQRNRLNAKKGTANLLFFRHITSAKHHQWFTQVNYLTTILKVFVYIKPIGFDITNFAKGYSTWNSIFHDWKSSAVLLFCSRLFQFYILYLWPIVGLKI